VEHIKNILFHGLNESFLPIVIISGRCNTSSLRVFSPPHIIWYFIKISLSHTYVLNPININFHIISYFVIFLQRYWKTPNLSDRMDLSGYMTQFSIEKNFVFSHYSKLYIFFTNNLKSFPADKIINLFWDLCIVRSLRRNMSPMIRKGWKCQRGNEKPYINVRKHRRGQWRMDNPEKLTTSGTHDTGRRQTKQKPQHRKLKRWATRAPPKPRWRGWIQVFVKGKQFLLLIRHSLIYTVRFSKGIGSNRGKKVST